MEVTNSQGSLLTLQLGDISDGINILDIAGLDPVKATLVSANFANHDGAVYQSSNRGSRNITLKLGLDPDPSVTSVLSLRRYVYSFFRPKDEITLKFYVDDTDDSVEDGYEIVGRVEYCNSPMFGPEPVVDISVLCFDPDFQDPVPVNVAGLTTADLAATVIAYPGTVPTGIVFKLNVNRSVASFTLSYTDPSGSIWTMDFAYAMVAGDVITISTIPGDKYATLVRAGVTSSVLYGVSPQSVWPELAPGNNSVKVSASGAGIPASVSYIKRYGEL